MPDPSVTAPDPSAAPDGIGARRARHVAAAIVLAAATATIYGQTRHFGHVPLDDYVTGNVHVLGGLTSENVVWAWTTSEIAALYQPLVWLSYQTEATFFGDDPGAMHVTNAVLHFLNAVLLYALLVRTTARTGPSFVVAALFAVHPLKVESVAWITERKDLLSAFFGLLALHAYVARVRTGRRWWTVAGLACFAASLLSKQMLVTLPCVLLLLDAWPLRRVGPETGTRLPLGSVRTWRRLVVEKLPWFAVSAGFCVAAVVAQRGGSAVIPLTMLPLPNRIANAMQAYVSYLATTVRPTNLAAFYPHPARELSWLRAGGAAAIVAGLTVAAAKAWRRRPAVPIGWFWFLGTLVPVIGLVQVGNQQSADRFTYFPQIGLFVAFAFLLDDLLPQGRIRRTVAPLAASVLLAALVLASRTQTAYWKDGRTLARRALAVTQSNELALHLYSAALIRSGNDAAAIAVRSLFDSNPAHVAVMREMAQALQSQGRLEDGLREMRDWQASAPRDAQPANAAGTLLLLAGRTDEAIRAFEEAVRIDPRLVSALTNLGGALDGRKRHAEAAERYRAALAVEPDQWQAHYGLARALRASGDPAGARPHYEAALAARPELAFVRLECAELLLELGDRRAALAQLDVVRRLDPNLPGLADALVRAGSK